MPESQLINFVLGRELKLLRTQSYRHGYLWEVEKIRQGPEVCPRCATPSSRRYGKATALVRDEDVRGKPIWLRLRKHRYDCASCRKPFTEPVDGIMPRRRSSQRFRKRVLADADQFTNLAQVGRRHRCSRSLVGQIFYEQMEIKLRERKSESWPRVLGIDEHRFRRGKYGPDFVTMLTDVGRKRAFELAETK